MQPQLSREIDRAFELLLKAASLASMAMVLNNARELVFPRNLKPHHIYTPRSAARVLKMTRQEVLDLIARGELKAKEVEGRYLILGTNISRFLNS